jgi:hypothetical protein
MNADFDIAQIDFSTSSQKKSGNNFPDFFKDIFYLEINDSLAEYFFSHLVVAQ